MILAGPKNLAERMGVNLKEVPVGPIMLRRELNQGYKIKREELHIL
tara:strand:- start:265 stop:402 length:138 start_codon:yes stop_codon:yes gene_type:complete